MTKHPKKLSPLDQIGWLSEQTQELQSWFAANGRWRNVTAGQALYLADDASDGFYGLGSGALDAEFAVKGVETLVRTRCQPGAWIGQGSLLPNRNRPVNLIAPTDSRVFFVPRQALRALLSYRPDFWPAFYALAIEHILILTNVLGETLALPPVARLARLLLRLSVVDAEVSASQHDLSALLCMPRTSLRRAVRTLTDAVVICTSYGRITVIDRAGLERYAMNTAATQPASLTA